MDNYKYKSQFAILLGGLQIFCRRENWKTLDKLASYAATPTREYVDPEDSTFKKICKNVSL